MTGRHEHSAGLSRRTVLRAATASGVLSWNGLAVRGASAQEADGTPETGRAIGNAEDLSIPPGISLAANEPSEASEPRPGGALEIVRPGASVANFNPAAFAQDPQIPVSYLEPLVRPDPRTLRPRPWLASRWHWRENGYALAITIRDGVFWHDGSPVTVSDAAFSYQVYQEDIESSVSGLFGLVAEVAVDSELELVVRFSAPDATWLFNAATLPVFSRNQYHEFWETMPENARTLSAFNWSESLPLGTGPWRVVAWDQPRVEFARFEGYWRGAAWFDSLAVTVEEGSRNRLDAWVSGDSQIAWPVRPGDLEAIETAKGTLYPAPAASVMFAAFNFANPEQPAGSLWVDPQVRRATSMAIDRARYASEVFGGFIRWDAAGAVAQPWANDASLVTAAHDPETASVLLAEAGWVDYDGDGILEDVNGWPLRPVVILRADSRPELASVLASVARDLAGVGIGLTIESLSADAFAERWISRRNYDLIAFAYDQPPGFVDFDLYGSVWDIRSNPAGWNPGGYANEVADAAIDEYLAAISIERQANALRRLQRTVNDDLFALWFGFPQDLVLIAANVAGFEPDMAWQTARTWELWQAIDAE